jgi:hypothetical protein
LVSVRESAHGLRLNPEGKFPREQQPHRSPMAATGQITLSDKRLAWRVEQQGSVQFGLQERKSCHGPPHVCPSCGDSSDHLQRRFIPGAHVERQSPYMDRCRLRGERHACVVNRLAAEGSVGALGAARGPSMTLKIAIQPDRPNEKRPSLPGAGLSLRHRAMAKSSPSMRFCVTPSPLITRCDGSMWRFCARTQSPAARLGRRHHRGSHLHFRNPP